MRTPADVLADLRADPCGARVLAVLEGADAWIVGGAVRDLLLGRVPREIDVAVDGDAGAIARRLGGEVREHDRFGTVVLRLDDGCSVDLARTRRERYPRPGALPDVMPAGIDEDLLRRDVTVNAIALSPAGDLRAVPQALEDLEHGVLRVLHDASFADDPTRLWRLVRYASRFGWATDPHTAQLAAGAVRDGALGTVSGDRLGNELRLLLREPDPLTALHMAQNLGLVSGLNLDPDVLHRAARLLPSGEGRPDLLLLGAVIPDARWPLPFGFTAADLRVLGRCAEAVPARTGTPSEIAASLRGEPVEAVCVAGARGEPAAAAWWLAEGRRIALEIDGDDLLAAGISQGPEVGERLQRALDATLDGRAIGRDAQLRVALA